MAIKIDGVCTMSSKQMIAGVFLHQRARSNLTHQVQSVATSPPLHHHHRHVFSLCLCLPSPSTFCPLPLASFHLSSLIPLSPPSLLPSFSHPRRGRDLIIISQARPYQETWLLMREKSILLSLSTSFSSASLSLPQSIYPPSLFFN